MKLNPIKVQKRKKQWEGILAQADKKTKRKKNSSLQTLIV
jgi:hypothetical protein